MLRLTVLSNLYIMLSEETHSPTSFPSDGEVGEIVRAVCPTAGQETPRRYPVSLVVKLPPGATEIDRARILCRMEDKVSRSQY
ncbi:MAG: hypothetical protein Q7R90_03400 [bacterium]|nr:hypothetical protein [bacterium]